jgi:nucleoside-diphosphate-sugar epimerase
MNPQLKKTVFATGGCGYIGSHTVLALKEKGYSVIVLDNLIYKQTSVAPFTFNKNFTFVLGDVTNELILKPLVENHDVIIPLAALVGAPICNQDPVGATTINHDSIIMMLKLVSNNQLILMPTTNSAYGSGDKNNFCTEESPLNPISKYAIDKVEIEKSLMQHPNAISFRLATVFGMSPRMRIDLLVNDFTYRAVYDGFVVLFESHFKRNYVHVKDVSRVFQHALLNHENMKGQIYNVGLSEANVSKFELCERIQKHIPSFTFLEAPLGKDPDQRNYVVSNEKLEATGYKTIYSLDHGIEELIKGFSMIKNTKYGNV